MKKLCAAALAALVLCGSGLMSGCSDFAFNPIGKWENVSDTDSLYDESFYLVFRHNGTAYMTLGDEYVNNSELSYTYDDEKVVITNKKNSSAVEYTVKENGTVLENSDSAITFKRV